MIDIENSLLLVIDIQEKLVKMLGSSNLPDNATVLAKSADILDIPVIITEQYPKGLGETIPQIKSNVFKAKYFEKNTFSAILNENILENMKENNRKQIIICGIEAHICVLQTALDLKKLGYEVFFVNDCSASRKQHDYKTAIDLMHQYDVKIVSKEIVLFSWLKSSKNPNFKEIQTLIK